jgi:Resolvase, N terminal domain
VATDSWQVESGKRRSRPELENALAVCKRQRAKLVIAKLDRLSRNLAFIATLMDSGVEFVAVDKPHANKLTIHLGEAARLTGLGKTTLARAIKAGRLPAMPPVTTEGRDLKSENPPMGVGRFFQPPLRRDLRSANPQSLNRVTLSRQRAAELAEHNTASLGGLQCIPWAAH